MAGSVMSVDSIVHSGILIHSISLFQRQRTKGQQVPQSSVMAISDHIGEQYRPSYRPC